MQNEHFISHIFQVFLALCTLLNLFLMIKRRKKRYSAQRQISNPRKSIFENFDVIFLGVQCFRRRQWLFTVNTFKIKKINEEMNLLLVQQKLIIFSQKYKFWPFFINMVQNRNSFSQRTGKISKSPWLFSRSKLLRTLCYFLIFLSLLACEDPEQLCNSTFQKIRDFISFILVRCPFVACYALSSVFYYSSTSQVFELLVSWLVSNESSLTNTLKTVIFFDFRPL